MQRTDTGTVECALHFQAGFRGPALQHNFTLLFLPCQQLLARFKGGSTLGGIIFCRRFIRSPTFFIVIL
jgi:hypothetical protein